MADDEVSTNVFGFPIKAKGINTLTLLIMAGALAFSLWLMYTRTEENDTKLISIKTDLALRANEHIEMVAALKNLSEAKQSTSTAINEQNYIILAEGEERKQIKKGLAMPQSLKDKINR